MGINMWIILFLIISIFSFLLTGITIFIFKKYKKIKKIFIIIFIINIALFLMTNSIKKEYYSDTDTKKHYLDVETEEYYFKNGYKYEKISLDSLNSYLSESKYCNKKDFYKDEKDLIIDNDNYFNYFLIKTKIKDKLSLMNILINKLIIIEDIEEINDTKILEIVGKVEPIQIVPMNYNFRGKTKDNVSIDLWFEDNSKLFIYFLRNSDYNIRFITNINIEDYNNRPIVLDNKDISYFGQNETYFKFIEAYKIH